MEPYLKPARTAGGTLSTRVPLWNLPQTSPDHPAALEEIGVRSTTGWWNPGGNLVELSRNLTSNHPLQPWWNLCGTLPQSTPNPGGNLADGGTHLVEPWWNSGGTLAQGRPEPPRSLSGLRPQSFQLLGNEKKEKQEKKKKHTHRTLGDEPPASRACASSTWRITVLSDLTSAWRMATWGGGHLVFLELQKPKVVSCWGVVCFFVFVLFICFGGALPPFLWWSRKHQREQQREKQRENQRKNPPFWGVPSKKTQPSAVGVFLAIGSKCWQRPTRIGYEGSANQDPPAAKTAREPTSSFAAAGGLTLRRSSVRKDLCFESLFR